MLVNPRVPPARSSITSVAIGISLGVLLGLATSLVFFLIVVGPLLGLGLALAALTSGIDDRPQANVGGGLLIGTGSVYLLGALNTVNSCQGQDVCGGASAVPFLAFAVAVLAVGLLVEGITFARQP
jgi:hypothetical protein